MTRLVLLGAGAAHLSALRHWRGGAAFLLISRQSHEADPGTMAAALRGERRWADIDIEHVVERAGGRFVRADITGLDLAERQIRLAGGRFAPFDLLSLDLGAASAALPGAIPLRPLAAFVKELRRSDARSVAVVGAGAVGVELACALAARRDGPRPCLISASGPLAHAPRPIRRRAEAALRGAGITFIAGRVVAVDASGVALAEGGRIPADAVVWAAGRVAPPLLAASGLACSDGFVQVDATLRSLSHPFVFAAGNCVALGGATSAASAVPAGAHLAGNLARALAGQPLLPWSPPRHALAVVGLGKHRALAWRGELWLAGQLAGRLKAVRDESWLRSLR